MQQKMWVYKEYNEEEVDRLAAGAGISRLVAKVFVSRGVSGPEGIEYVKGFLDIDEARLHDPFLMDGMDVAVERVLRAVAGREKILIHGDYDVDGVTGTSILYDFLKLLGADAVYFIPDRMEDGYGLTMSSAAKVKELAPSLVITVDCGITSVEEVRWLMESGIDVIVTDHHECMQELPQAVAVLNPHRPGCRYPFSELSGAGVAFKLIQAICARVAEGKARVAGGEANGTAAAYGSVAGGTDSSAASVAGGTDNSAASVSDGSAASATDGRVSSVSDGSAASATDGSAATANDSRGFVSDPGAGALSTNTVSSDTVSADPYMDSNAGNINEDTYLKYIDLVALSTIADIVPLTGENRIIAGLGLKAMQTTKNVGLDALIKVSGFGGREIDTFAVAFGLAPRVNAAGRLGSADRAVRLFTTDNPLLAEVLAKELNEENRLRQETENEIFGQAVAFVEEKLDPAREKVLVVCGEGWHHGVIGIVASKIAERYYRPTIIISLEEDGTGKASARSIEKFDLFRALTACEDLLDRYGGHEMAAGLTIQGSRIEEFRKRINEYADSVMVDEDLMPRLRIDAFVENSDLTLESVQELDKMEPFGEANPKPCFGYVGLRIADIRTMSSGKHLRLMLYAGCTPVEAVGFGMGELAQQYRVGDVVDLAFVPGINEWRGARRLQLVVRDIRPGVFAKLDKNIVFTMSNDYNNNDIKLISSLRQQYRLDPADLVPERAELEQVYRYVRAHWRAGTANGSDSDPGKGGSAFIIENIHELSTLMSARLGIRMNCFKLKKALEIFTELGLMTLESAGPGGLVVRQADGADRVCLEASTLYTRLQAIRRVFNGEQAQNM